MDKTYGIKKIKHILFAICLIFGLMLAGKVQASADTITVSVERFAMGGDFIVEPVSVNFTQGESCADILVRVLKKNNLTFSQTGNGAGFYLAGIDGVDCGTSNIPASVREILSQMGITLGAHKSSGLYEKDYTEYSGWMYSLNDVFPDMGFGAVYPKNGDVMRVMYEICFGAELSGELKQSYEGLDPQRFYSTVDKSSLMRIMGSVNRNRSRWESVDGFSAAYQNAVSVMAAMSANEADALAVSGAVSWLQDIQKELPAEPTSITLSENSLTLSAGGSSATLKYTTLPAGTLTDVTWSSDNASIATVSNGTVTPRSAGTTTIWAETSNGLKASCSVTVSEKPIDPTDIIFSKSELKFNLGSAAQTLSYGLYPQGATSSVTWSSDNPAVATVSNSGVVTPVSLGETDIRITTANGCKDVCHVYVTQEITGITLQSDMTISQDEEPTAISYTLAPQGAQANLTWTSDNESIAKVDQKGMVTPVSVGKTTIHVKSENGLRASCTVTVTASYKSEFTSGEPVISVKATAYNSVKVTWKEYKYAESYIVSRRIVGSGSWTELAAVTDLSYTDKTAVPGTSYYYTVKAASKKWGKEVYSKYTTNVNVKTSIGKAALTKVQSASYNSIKLTWGKVDGASGYVIYRATSSNGSYSNIGSVTKGTTVTYTDKKSLTAGKAYYYKVRAYRTVSGKKVYGTASTAKGTKPVPSKPTLKAAAGSRKADLKWSKVSGASGYQVVYSTSKASGYKTLKTITKGSTVSYTKTGLTKGRTYYYRVRAYRTVSGKKVYGAYSDVKSVKVK